MRKIYLTLIFAFLVTLSCAAPPTIVHVPLDERFTTRIAFLNMAKITPYQIQSLPERLLPSLKKYSPPSELLKWTINTAESADAGILSLQSLIYGSLIASRISNDTFEAVKANVDSLISFKKSHPRFKMYLSAVVMRIPHYNGDFEEPWYWAQYGQLLYTYSYYCDKYNKTKSQADLQTCENARNGIPGNILTQFLWRRTRNHQISLYLLQCLNGNKGLFEKLYITLDDSAQYGYNANEANQIIGKVKQYGLSEVVKVYPGADEVAFALLSNFAIGERGLGQPEIAMVFRNVSTASNIPNYEGLPMIQTLQNQISAAGGRAINGSLLRRGNVTLLINNFDEDRQMEANVQGPANEKFYNISFDNYLCFGNKTEMIGFVDNRYSNGADVFFVNYLVDRVRDCRNLTQWAFAGWNTNGNTVGTVIANTILLWAFKGNKLSTRTQSVGRGEDTYVSPCSQGDVLCANSYFNMLRIIEDKDWQSILRELMRNYIYQTPGDNINDLTNDLKFYQTYAYKSLSAKLKKLKSQFNFNFSLDGIYFPWNRTFEIGLYGSLDQPRASTRLPHHSAIREQ